MVQHYHFSSAVLYHFIVVNVQKQNYEKYFNNMGESSVNPLGPNPTKWSNTLKQFVGCCRGID